MTGELKPRDWLLVLLPAVLCRGFVFWHQFGQPVFQKYIYLGRHLADGGTVPFYSSPVYTVWMHLLNHRAGAGPDMLRGLQFLAGLISVVLAVRIAAALFGRAEAIAAGWLAGLTGPLMVYESDLVTASLVILFQSATAWLLIRTISSAQPRSMHWLAAGLLLGVSIGIRPNMLLALPLLAILIVINSPWRTHARVYLPLFLIGTCLAVAPVTIWNMTRSGEFILTTGSGGSVFYSSNNYRASGLGYSPPPALTEIENRWMLTHRTDRPVEHAIFKFLAERASGRRLSHRETSAFYMDLGWRYLGGDPGRAAAFWARKLLYLFNNYEVLDTASLISASHRISALLPVLLPGGVVLMLGLFGLGRPSAWDRRYAVLAALMVPHVITGMVFYVNGRLRAPLLFLLVVPAGDAAVRLFRMIRSRDPSIWLSLLTVMGLTALVSYPFSAVETHRTVETPGFYNTVLGLAALHAGDSGGAETFLSEAVSANPLGSREAWENLALIYEHSGRTVQAAAARQRGSGIWPEDALDRLVTGGRITRYEQIMSRARFAWLEGRRNESLALFREATREYPLHPDPWFNCALAMASTAANWRRVVDDTERALDLGMQLSLESERAHRLLIRGYEALDMPDRADAAAQQLAWEQGMMFSPEGVPAN